MRKIIVTATAIMLAVFIPFRAFAASTTSFSMAPVKVPELEQGIMLYYSGSKPLLTTNIFRNTDLEPENMYLYYNPVSRTGVTGARLILGLDIPDSVSGDATITFRVNSVTLDSAVSGAQPHYIRPSQLQVHLSEIGWSAMDYVNNNADIVASYYSDNLPNPTLDGYYITLDVPAGAYNALGGQAVIDIFWFIGGTAEYDPIPTVQRYAGFTFSQTGYVGALDADTGFIVDAVGDAADKVTSAIDQATDKVTSAIDGAVNEDFGYSKPDTGITDNALNQGNDILGQMQSSMDGFGVQIEQATDDLTSQLEPISDVVSGVWDMLPPPIIAATGGVVVFLVVRKVVGR